MGIILFNLFVKTLQFLWFTAQERAELLLLIYQTLMLLPCNLYLLDNILQSRYQLLILLLWLNYHRHKLLILLPQFLLLLLDFEYNLLTMIELSLPLPVLLLQFIELFLFSPYFLFDLLVFQLELPLLLLQVLNIRVDFHHPSFLWSNLLVVTRLQLFQLCRKAAYLML